MTRAANEKGGTVRRRILLAALACAIVSVHPSAATRQLPERLSDDEFWILVQELSEPDGVFEAGLTRFSENELGVPDVIPGLTARLAPGGVYLGVGPEQNFSYIAALNPAIAFIVDIRRGNRDVHLLYKALFELSSDRADFLSRLFGRPRPSGLRADATVAELFTAYDAVVPSAEAHAANVARVRAHLRQTRGLPLSTAELQAIERIQGAFVEFGPAIHYWSGDSERYPGQPSYAMLMMDTDAGGEPRSFLASEDLFRTVQDLHRRNKIVPVVGDFAGPTALRAVGRWLAGRGTGVSAFYLSNVEPFLKRAQKWTAFCQNVGMLPLTPASTFIRVDVSKHDRRGRQMVAHGRTADGRVTVRWADGTSEAMTENEFAVVYRAISGFETGPLLDLSQSCRGSPPVPVDRARDVLKLAPTLQHPRMCAVIHVDGGRTRTMK
jgi:hypothetical protein